MTERERVSRELELLEAESASFARIFIKEAAVRRRYMEAIRRYSDGLLAEVERGVRTASDAAVEASEFRNLQLEASRMQSSPWGRSLAKTLKAEGRSFSSLLETYAQKIYRKPLGSLTRKQQERVYLQIIVKAGEARPRINALMRRVGRAGKGLLVLTVAIAVYNVASAEDKGEAVAQEALAIGGGVVGGALGGGVAGLVCGPGSPICVTLGIFVGGALGALGLDLAFDWMRDTPARPARAVPVHGR